MTPLSERRPTQVVLVGRDTPTTTALRRIMSLDSGLRITTALPAIAAIAGQQPDVVLYTDEASSALGAAQRSRDVFPRAAFYLLDAVAGLTIGEFLHAVKTLAIAPSATHLRVVGSASANPVSPLASLTQREFQVVRLVAEGLSNKEISSRLRLSDKTIKNHISHILAKLHLKARTQLAILAVRSGLV
jgi:two-component system nitrate/nitrite response regulator NarL